MTFLNEVFVREVVDSTFFFVQLFGKYLSSEQ